MKLKTKILIALAASLTLGLAPFRPEPHIWGKVKWLIGGAEGMELTDIWDLILHGSPWVALVFFMAQWTVRFFRRKTTNS